MREMKDSGIKWLGEIPVDWHTKRIKHIYSIVSGSTPQSNNADYWDGEIIWITPADYKTSDKYVSKGKRNITNAGFLSCSTSIIPKGSIIFSKRAPIGTVAINTVELCTNQGCLSCISKINCSNTYFYYTMSVFTEQFELLGSGTTFKEISLNSFSNFCLPFPSYSIQKKLASFLDDKCSEIDTLKSDIQKQIETLEEYKRSIISETVTRGLNRCVEMKDSGVEWVGKVPVHWSFARIGSLYGLRNEKVSDYDYPPLSVTKQGIMPQLETAAKTNAHDDRKLVKKGDFAINSRSDRRGSCGISEYEGSVSLINTVLYPIIEMNPQFYNWLFHTTLFADEFYRWGHGIADDLWTTGWQDMKNIVIVSPPLAEQKEIADYLDTKCADIDSIIADKKKQLETLDEYKKSLIYEYVTGKKEVVCCPTVFIDPMIITALILNNAASDFGGKVKVQKAVHLCTHFLGLPYKNPYYRYEHGPYDKNIDSYLKEINRKQWFNIKDGSKMTWSKGKKHAELLKIQKEYANYISGMKEIINFLKPMKTSEAERIATLYAVWNDLIIEGVSQPTDTQIINETMTNWTPNKANPKYETWQNSLEKLKKRKLIPTGFGHHTKK